MKKEKSGIWKKIVIFQTAIIVSWIIGMLWAFPIKWAWNYTITYIFGLPELTWLHAWLLWGILSSLWRLTTINVN